MTASSMALLGARRPTLTQRAPGAGGAAPRAGGAPVPDSVGTMAAGGTTAVRWKPAWRNSASLKDDTARPSAARGASACSWVWARSWWRAMPLSHGA
jgi:hypothetical protein